MQVNSVQNLNQTYQSNQDKNSMIEEKKEYSQMLDFLPEKYQDMIDGALDDAGITDDLERSFLKGYVEAVAELTEVVKRKEAGLSTDNFTFSSDMYTTKSSFLELVNNVYNSAHLSGNSQNYRDFATSLYELFQKDDGNELDTKV